MFWQKSAAVTHDVFLMRLNTECLHMHESCHMYEWVMCTYKSNMSACEGVNKIVLSKISRQNSAAVAHDVAWVTSTYVAWVASTSVVREDINIWASRVNTWMSNAYTWINYVNASLMFFFMCKHYSFMCWHDSLVHWCPSSLQGGVDS